LPMVVGMMTAGIGVGQFTSRTGKIRIFPIIGSALAGASMIALSRVNADTSLGWVMFGMLFLGLGIGQCMQPLTIIVQNAVPPREIGVATSSATFFRQLGGTLGVAVFLSLLFSTLGKNIQDSFKTAVPGIQKAAAEGKIPHTTLNDQVLSGLQNPGQGGGVFKAVQDDSSIIGRMNPVIGHPFKVGFSDSMSLVLLCGGLVMLIAFLILLLMPKVELRTSSASAAARAESNAAAGEAPVEGRVEAPVEGGAHRAPVESGAHRAPVATVVGDDPDGAGGAELPVTEGRHAAPAGDEETSDPR
ncbi:MAG: MFS transporter, partial [Marmoricola sp.]